MTLSGNPHKRTEEGEARRREQDRIRKQRARENKTQRDKENKAARERRKADKGQDDWLVYGWEDGYVAMRGGIEAYRPWLRRLHGSDLRRGTQRLCVWQTTPLTVELRAEMPRVWQTPRSATIQIPGFPLIKRFKVTDPSIENPIPIGEGELVRRYLSSHRKGKHLFPKSIYNKVTNAPIFFCPQAAPDLLEIDCEYVDITRCYSQLLERLPSLVIRFDYGARRFEPVGHLPPHDPELLASKHWGRATVGMMRQLLGRTFIYGEPVRFPSSFYSGDTANWIHAILHSLASYAIQECGCFRWHTDGGFFPRNGGRKFSKLLASLGILHSLDELAAVCFASVDQYEAIYRDGTVKQTKLFLSTYLDDYIFESKEMGGGQRNNIIHGLNAKWLYSTLERAA